MKSLAALVVVSMFLAAVAYAEGIGGGVGIEGTNYGVGEPSGISYKIGGGGSGPTGCTGAVDLSAGCALPMLHGVP